MFHFFVGSCQERILASSWFSREATWCDRVVAFKISHICRKSWYRLNSGAEFSICQDSKWYIEMLLEHVGRLKFLFLFMKCICWGWGCVWSAQLYVHLSNFILVATWKDRPIYGVIDVCKIKFAFEYKFCNVNWNIRE